MLLYKCIKMYRTASQFFGFYPKFIQGKKSHKNQTEKFKTKLRKIRQNPRKTLDIFALCSNKIQSQNYTFVIPLFLLIQKLYEKSAVSHAHRGLKKYTTFNCLSLLIRMSLVRVQLPEPRISADFCGFFIVCRSPHFYAKLDKTCPNDIL